MMKTHIVQRRQFLKSTAAAGIGLLILPSGTLCGARAPSNKLNIALIGVWGRGLAHYDAISTENVVALCDVDEKHMADAAKKFPKAKPGASASSKRTWMWLSVAPPITRTPSSPTGR